MRRFWYRNFRAVTGLQYRLARRLTPAGQLVAAGVAAAAIVGPNTRITVSYQALTFLAALLLVDTEVALIPSMRSYDPGQELRASVVRHPQLVEALVWLFEAVWDQSVPIMASGYNDPRRQMLISLLMTGSTDSAIATQLGINVRSLRRWISELMDELGVTTRLQLGAALVRSDSLNMKRR